MTLIDIENYLKNLIKNAIEDLKLKDKNGNPSNISVLTGLLPPKNYYKTINEYPFVLLRTHKSNTNRATKEINKKFIVYLGVCAEKENLSQNQSSFDISNYEQGHQDLNNLFERIELKLLEKPYFEYGHIEKIDFEAFLEQPFPYFLGQISIEISGSLLIKEGFSEY